VDQAITWKLTFDYAGSWDLGFRRDFTSQTSWGGQLCDHFVFCLDGFGYDLAGPGDKELDSGVRTEAFETRRSITSGAFFLQEMVGFRDELFLTAGLRVDGHSAFGAAALSAWPVSGRPPKLTARQRQELEALLLAGPEAAGFATDLWTCPRVRDLIRSRFSVRCHVDHIGRLQRSLGWSPQRRAVEPDEDKIQGCIKTTWPRNKKKTARLKTWLVFLDESGFLMAPLVRRGWRPAKRPSVVVQRGRGHKRASAIAALCVSPTRAFLSDDPGIHLSPPPGPFFRRGGFLGTQGDWGSGGGCRNRPEGQRAGCGS